MTQGTEFHFLVGTVILGSLSIFKNSQVSSPYEALNSVCVSGGQRNVRSTVQMTRTPTAFNRVSTVHSDMHSSGEMKNESEFKPLQGNRASSLREGEGSWFFSSCGGNLGYILELRQGEPLTTFVFFSDVRTPL